mgnify:CR=1 FL=1
MKELGKFFLDNGMFTFVRWGSFMCNPPLVITEEQLRGYQETINEDGRRSKPRTQTGSKDESLQQLPIYKIITDDEFFATSGIPTTFIINSDGEVIVKDLGTAFWNDESVFKFIDELIGNNEV